jgi:glutamate--cysteine ligase
LNPGISYSLSVRLPSEKPWEKTAGLLAASCRKPEKRSIGLEIERIGIWEDGYALHYRQGEPFPLRPGGEQLLSLIGKTLGWKITTYSEAFPLGLSGTTGKVSLEPGSQLEFSANPAPSVIDALRLVKDFEDKVESVTAPWGLRWIGLGVNPLAKADDQDVIPLTRYQIMTDYLGKRAALGTSMMRLSSSIQINFDYASEREAIQMLQAALAAAPLSCALFGNSPFYLGKPSGWLSFRSEIWRNTDSERAGLFPEAFQENFSFEKYCELAWKRPLMFVQNSKGVNVESHRRTLQEVALGQLEGCALNAENELFSLNQFFAEARIKPGYVEVRSIDGLRPAERAGAIAFWTGILYSEEARLLAIDRLGTLSPRLRDELWVAAGKDGLRASVGGLSLRALAKDLFTISRRKLIDRGLGEDKLLASVERSIQDSKNPADRVLELFNGPWKQDFAEVIRYSADRSE